MEVTKKNCCSCGQIFIPNWRLGERQKTCGSTKCKKKLNKENQRIWRSKNQDYHKGQYEKTKVWRDNNPGHQKRWRKKRNEIQNSIHLLSPLKSIRCLVPVKLLKSEIQNSILVLTPIDSLTYKGWMGTRDTKLDRNLSSEEIT